MASLSSRPPQVPSAPTAPRSTDWGRSTERGAAFRGIGRGRGGRGGDRGRGGRGGGRGGGAPRTGRISGPLSTDAGDKIPGARAEQNSSGKSNASTLPQSSPGTDTISARSKPANNRAPARKVPALNVQPASPVVDSFRSTPNPVPSANPSSPRPSARRRRSHQQKTSVSSSGSKNSLTVEPALANAKPQKGKARSDPASPHAPPKDAPPHLSADPTVTSFDVKANIDSLVERMRAVAMENRPTTPGSHIDWADDDDTLPDLDDWGVPPSAGLHPPATSTGASKLELMSPILDDSLKQLPTIDTVASPAVNGGSLSPRSPVPSKAAANIDTAVKGRNGQITNNGSKSPRSSGRQAAAKPRSPVQDPNATPQARKPFNGQVKSNNHQFERAAPPPRLPLHPSLPPKPVGALDSTGPKSPLRSPRRDPPPHHAATAAAISQLPAKPTPSEAAPQPAPSESEPALVEPTLPSSQAEVATNEPAPPTGGQPTVEAQEPGLEASIHAPKSSASETALSSLATPPHTAPPFNPSHGRSRTLGRPAFAPGGGLPHRAFQSGNNTPLAAGAHHARTQSTPPEALSTRHARHLSRPVISSDAMAKLARTLGGAGIGVAKRGAGSSNTSASSD